MKLGGRELAYAGGIHLFFGAKEERTDNFKQSSAERPPIRPYPTVQSHAVRVCLPGLPVRSPPRHTPEARVVPPPPPQRIGSGRVEKQRPAFVPVPKEWLSVPK